MDFQWDSLTPFQPLVSKDSQLSVALLLVLAGSLYLMAAYSSHSLTNVADIFYLGFSLTGLFSISTPLLFLNYDDVYCLAIFN